MVKNPPANAGDTGSIPGPRKLHMPQCRGPRTTTTELVRCSPAATEATAMRSPKRNKGWPTRQKPRKPVRSDEDPAQSEINKI